MKNMTSYPDWKRLFTTANASGEAQARGRLWEEYFADPSQWWDNRVGKRYPKSPDFRHKISREALWVDGWSTPSWVKAKLKKPVTQDKSQPPVGYQTRGCDDSRPTITRELRQIIGQVRDGSTLMQRSASPASEAVATLKNHVEQGIAVESYRYVQVLQSCFKQRDLVSAKEVHECSRKSGMEQNVYVVNNLLRVFIRCGRLQDARQVFAKSERKSFISWNIMIGGYAQHGHAAIALQDFNQMCQQKSVQANKITYLSILQACASSAMDMERGKEIHAHIRRCGFESNVRVGTALLNMYAKCGSIKDATEVFDNRTSPNVISWNALIGAHARSGCGVEAYQLFLRMQ